MRREVDVEEEEEEDDEEEEEVDDEEVDDEEEDGEEEVDDEEEEDDEEVFSLTPHSLVSSFPTSLPLFCNPRSSAFSFPPLYLQTSLALPSIPR